MCIIFSLLQVGIGAACIVIFLTCYIVLYPPCTLFPLMIPVGVETDQTINSTNFLPSHFMPCGNPWNYTEVCINIYNIIVVPCWYDIQVEFYDSIPVMILALDGISSQGMNKCWSGIIITYAVLMLSYCSYYNALKLALKASLSDHRLPQLCMHAWSL